MHILIADDHGLFRDSMRAWLSQSEAGYRVDTVASLPEVLDSLQQAPGYGLVLLDLNMPGMQGAQSVASVVRQAADMPVIVVSANENRHIVQACLDAGAAGFVPKSFEGDSILSAIQSVLAGGTFVPRNLRWDVEANKLSDKQMQMLALIAEGASNREIAGQLQLTEGTVKQYVSDILLKLNVDNRTQAALVARDMLGSR